MNDTCGPASGWRESRRQSAPSGPSGARTLPKVPQNRTRERFGNVYFRSQVFFFLSSTRRLFYFIYYFYVSASRYLSKPSQRKSSVRALPRVTHRNLGGSPGAGEHCCPLPMTPAGGGRQVNSGPGERQVRDWKQQVGGYLMLMKLQIRRPNYRRGATARL